MKANGNQCVVLRSLFWLWIPVSVFVLQVVIELSVSQRKYTLLYTENGPIELVQAYLLFIAAVLAVRWLLRECKNADLFMKGWVALALLGCVYVGGEEISWGQHVFHWMTPEEWAAVNDQGETNLHNTSAWLDQKPRLILELGVIAGGVLMPAIARFRPLARFPLWMQRILPPGKLSVTAGLFLLVKIMDYIGDATHWVMIKRASEVGEFYMYYFVLLYLYWLTNAARNPEQ